MPAAARTPGLRRGPHGAPYTFLQRHVDRQQQQGPTRLWLDDSATTATGVLPGTGDTVSATSPASSDDARANHLLAQVQTPGPQVATGLSDALNYPELMRRYISAPLAAQTIPAGIWQINMGVSRDTAAGSVTWSVVIAVWRPSTGALVGRLYDQATTGSIIVPQSVEKSAVLAASGSALAVLDGDVLVLETWAITGIGGQTFFYDGSTEGGLSNYASYLDAPTQLAWLPAPVSDSGIMQANASTPRPTFGEQLIVTDFDDVQLDPGWVQAYGDAGLPVPTGSGSVQGVVGYAGAYYLPFGNQTDVEVNATISGLGGIVGITWRSSVAGGVPGTSAWDGYGLYVNTDGSWNVYKVTGGASASIASGGAGAIGSGDAVLCRMVGTAISVYVRPSGTTTFNLLAAFTDGTWSTGYVGIELNGSGARFTEWGAVTVTPLGTVEAIADSGNVQGFVTHARPAPWSTGVLDDFNQPDGALAAADWTVSNIVISNGKAVANNPAGGTAFRNTQFARPCEIYGSVDVTDNLYLYLCWSSQLASGTPNGYRANLIHSTGQVVLSRFDAGVESILNGSATGAWTTDDIIGLTNIAGALTVWRVRGGVYSVLTTWSDSTYTTGYAGFFCDTNGIMDSVGGGVISATATESVTSGNPSDSGTVQATATPSGNEAISDTAAMAALASMLASEALRDTATVTVVATMPGTDALLDSQTVQGTAATTGTEAIADSPAGAPDIVQATASFVGTEALADAGTVTASASLVTTGSDAVYDSPPGAVDIVQATASQTGSEAIADTSGTGTTATGGTTGSGTGVDAGTQQATVTPSAGLERLADQGTLTAAVTTTGADGPTDAGTVQAVGSTGVWGGISLLDDANRANENPLSGGGNWGSTMPTTDTGGLQVTGNAFAKTGAGPVGGPSWSSSRWEVVFGADQAVSARIASVSSNDAFGLFLRVTNPATASFTGYEGDIDFPNAVLTIYKWVSMAATPLGSLVIGTYAAGDIIGFSAVGTTLTVTRNGVVVKQITDSAISGGGKTGIAINNGGSGTLDDYRAGSLTGGASLETISDTGTNSASASTQGQFEDLADTGTVTAVATHTGVELVNPLLDSGTVTATASFTGAESLVDNGTQPGAAAATGAEAISDQGTCTATGSPTGSDVPADAGTATAAVITTGNETIADTSTVAATCTGTGSERYTDAGTQQATAAFTAAEAIVDASTTAATGAATGADAIADTATVTATATASGSDLPADTGTCQATASAPGSEAISDTGTTTGTGSNGTTEVLQDSGTSTATASFTAVEVVTPLTDSGTAAATATATGSEAIVDASTTSGSGTGTGSGATADSATQQATAAATGSEAIGDSGTATATATPTGTDTKADTGSSTATGSPTGNETLADSSTTAATSTGTGADAPAETTTQQATAAATGTENIADSSTVTGTATHTGVEVSSGADTGTCTATTSPTGVEAINDSSTTSSTGTTTGTDAPADTTTMPATGSNTGTENLADTSTCTATTAATSSEALRDQATNTATATPTAAETLAEPPGTSTATGAGSAAQEAIADTGTCSATATGTGSDVPLDVGTCAAAAAASGTEVLADTGTCPATATGTGSELYSDSGTCTGTGAATAAEVITDSGTSSAAASQATEFEDLADTGTCTATATHSGTESTTSSSVDDSGTCTATGVGTGSEALADTGSVQGTAYHGPVYSSYLAMVLAEAGLLGVWPLTEASGNFNDASGAGNTLTAAGAPVHQYATITPNDGTQGAQFNNGPHADAATYAPDTQVPLVVEAWVQLDTAPVSGAPRFISAGITGAGAGGWAAGITSARRWRFTTYGVKDYDFTTQPVLSVGVPTHVVFILDASFDVSLYVAGVFRQKIVHTGGGPLAGTAKLKVGGEGNNVAAERWLGGVQYGAVYSALSPASIAAHAGGTPINSVEAIVDSGTATCTAASTATEVAADTGTQAATAAATAAEALADTGAVTATGSTTGTDTLYDTGTCAATQVATGTEVLADSSTVTAASDTHGDGSTPGNGTVQGTATTTGSEVLADSGTSAASATFQNSTDAVADTGTTAATATADGTIASSDSGTSTGSGGTAAALEAITDTGALQAAATATGADALVDASTVTASGAGTGTEATAASSTATATVTASGSEAVADAGTAVATVVITAVEPANDSGTSTGTAAGTGAEALADTGSTEAAGTQPEPAEAVADTGAVAATATTTGDIVTYTDAGTCTCTATGTGTETLADSGVGSGLATHTGSGHLAGVAAIRRPSGTVTATHPGGTLTDVRPGAAVAPGRAGGSLRSGRAGASLQPGRARGQQAQ